EQGLRPDDDPDRQLEPGAGGRDLRPHRDPARPGGGDEVQQRQHLRPDRRERPPQRRLRGPILRRPDQRRDHGTPDHDRHAEAGLGRAGDGGDPLLRLRPDRQEGPAAGADHGPPGRQADRHRRHRPGVDPGPPRRSDPGVLRHPGRRDERDVFDRQLLPRKAAQGPGGGFAGPGQHQAGAQLRRDPGCLAGDHRKAADGQPGPLRDAEPDRLGRWLPGGDRRRRDRHRRLDHPGGGPLPPPRRDRGLRDLHPPGLLRPGGRPLGRQPAARGGGHQQHRAGPPPADRQGDDPLDRAAARGDDPAHPHRHQRRGGLPRRRDAADPAQLRRGRRQQRGRARV
ncbi:MAG: Ribose-phosphate pyrophosphokinase, partial [uncultured Thermomicrobiales bacterium]